MIFFNFCHCQIRKSKILNLFKQNQNFTVIIQKYQKSTKYFAISWKPSVIPLKFCEMSLVLWNLINYCKTLSQFLIKLGKSLKDLRTILLKWLGKTVKYQLNFNNFHSLKNGRKFGNVCPNFNESLRYSMKVFSVLNFWFEQNFVWFCLLYRQNLLIHGNI